MARKSLLAELMDVDPLAAAVSGLLAGGAMVAARVLLRLAGVPLRMDVMRMWSTMFGIHRGAGRAVGVAMHLAVSAAVGLAYAAGLAVLFGADDALWLWGLLGGVIHWALAGLFLVVAPEMNPEIPERIPAPGMFASRLGSADVAGFLAGHLAYGVTFGIAYGLLHPAGGIGAAF